MRASIHAAPRRALVPARGCGLRLLAERRLWRGLPGRGALDALERERRHCKDLGSWVIAVSPRAFGARQATRRRRYRAAAPIAASFVPPRRAAQTRGRARLRGVAALRRGRGGGARDAGSSNPELHGTPELPFGFAFLEARARAGGGGSPEPRVLAPGDGGTPMGSGFATPRQAQGHAERPGRPESWRVSDDRNESSPEVPGAGAIHSDALLQRQR